MQYLIGRGSNIIGKCATINRLKSGAPIEIIPYQNSEIWDTLDPVVQELIPLGLKGPINFQGRMTDAGPKYFELNPRFTGITGVRASLGFNEVEAAIVDFLGFNCELTPLVLNGKRIGIRQLMHKTVEYSSIPAIQRVVESVRKESTASGQTIMVTGASGFLGRHIIERLSAQEQISSIICISRDREGTERLFQKYKQAKVFTWDDIESGHLNPANVDGLIHAAFARGNAEYSKIADSMVKTAHLYSLAKQFHIPRIINISSQAVYGLKTPPPWDECTLPSPETVYGTAKLACELLAESIGRKDEETSITSLRLCRLIGEGLKEYEIVRRFLNAALNEAEIEIFGGTQEFDFLDVRDAADAVTDLMARPPDRWEKVYNIGSGHRISIIALAELANKIAGEFDRKGANFRVIEKENNQKFGVCTERIRRDTGWAPKIGIEETMREIAETLLQTINE